MIRMEYEQEGANERRAAANLLVVRTVEGVRARSPFELQVALVALAAMDVLAGYGDGKMHRPRSVA